MVDFPRLMTPEPSTKIHWGLPQTPSRFGRQAGRAAKQCGVLGLKTCFFQRACHWHRPIVHVWLGFRLKINIETSRWIFWETWLCGTWLWPMTHLLRYLWKIVIFHSGFKKPEGKSQWNPSEKQTSPIISPIYPMKSEWNPMKFPIYPMFFLKKEHKSHDIASKSIVPWVITFKSRGIPLIPEIKNPMLIPFKSH